VWLPVVTNLATGTIFQFTETNAPPHRFYRARLLP
jgi:hypothetical protein